MIWLGSNDSSPSFSPKHAYSVRTLLLGKENKIIMFKSNTVVFTLPSCNHACDTENHAHGGLNKTHFHMKTDYFPTVALEYMLTYFCIFNVLHWMKNFLMPDINMPLYSLQIALYFWYIYSYNSEQLHAFILSIL